MPFIDDSERKIIDFEKAKREIEFNKMKKNNEKILTKIALTSNNLSQYMFMDYMCKLSETSRRVANDPKLREKHKKLLRTRSK